MCKDFLKNKYNDYEYEIYEDEGFSGGNTNRPEFQRMMKDIEANKIDILICYRLDRISRNVADFSEVLEILQSYNVDFISITEQFDTSNPMGRAMIYIASVFAQLERETIAERVKDNMLEMAKNGRWTGGRVPVGYTSKRKQYIDEEGTERTYIQMIPDKEALKTVSLIYDKYLELGSIAKVETYMLQNNIKANKAYPTASSIRLILKNPVYCKAGEKVSKFLKSRGWEVYGELDNTHGMLSYNKTAQYRKNGKKLRKAKPTEEGNIAAVSNIPGIIDESDWIKVQKQLDENSDKKIAALGKSNTALLTGKLKCSNCKSPMVVKYKTDPNGTKRYYYSCSLKIRSKGSLCNAKNVNGSKLDSEIINSMELIRTKKNSLINLLEEYNNKLLASGTEGNISIATLNMEIDKLTNQINNIIDKITIDPDLMDLFKDRLKVLKKERDSLEQSLNDLENKNQNIQDFILDIQRINILLDSCDNLKEESFEKQKSVINSLVDVIFINAEKVNINLYGVDSDKVAFLLTQDMQSL